MYKKSNAIQGHLQTMSYLKIHIHGISI